MNWLEELKPGDRVFVSEYPRDRIAEVTRITKTLVVVGTTRFSRARGGLFGGGRYDRARLEEVTPEREQAVLGTKLVRLIKARSMADFSNERLLKIWELMKP